jgi:hypothetical protein
MQWKNERWSTSKFSCYYYDISHFDRLRYFSLYSGYTFGMYYKQQDSTFDFFKPISLDIDVYSLYTYRRPIICHFRFFLFPRQCGIYYKQWWGIQMNYQAATRRPRTDTSRDKWIHQSISVYLSLSLLLCLSFPIFYSRMLRFIGVRFLICHGWSVTQDNW